MKMKEFGPPGECASPGAPLGSANELLGGGRVSKKDSKYLKDLY